MIFNLGLSIKKLMEEYTVVNRVQEYVRGVLEVTLEEPYTILASIQPADFTDDQFYEPNSDRRYGKVAIFTIDELYLSEGTTHKTLIYYNGNAYSIQKEGDWKSTFGFYEYKGELLIDE